MAKEHGAPLRRAAAGMLVFCVAAAVGLAAPLQQSQPAPQQPPTSPGRVVAPQETSPSKTDLFSIEDLRKRLQRPPAIALPRPDGRLPVYRLRIEGYQFRLPSWKDSFVVKGSTEPLGGSDFHRMQWQAIAPATWGSPTPFAGVGPENTSGPGLSGLPALLTGKAVQARANGKVARAREEVLQELAEVAAHNAQVAAGQADPDTDEGRAAAKKKQDEEKKKQEDKAKRNEKKKQR